MNRRSNRVKKYRGKQTKTSTHKVTREMTFADIIVCYCFGWNQVGTTVRQTVVETKLLGLNWGRSQCCTTCRSVCGQVVRLSDGRFQSCKVGRMKSKQFDFAPTCGGRSQMLYNQVALCVVLLYNTELFWYPLPMSRSRQCVLAFLVGGPETHSVVQSFSCNSFRKFIWKMKFI